MTTTDPRPDTVADARSDPAGRTGPPKAVRSVDDRLLG